MAKPKGSPKTGGRQKGVKNKATSQRELLVAAGGQTPLEYLLNVMRTSDDGGMRLDAAKAAAPYVHPKLANMVLQGDKDAPLTVEIIRFAHPAP